MGNLKIGDRVNCRLKESQIVSPDSEFDDERTFEIIAVDDGGYYLFVPNYFNVKESYKLDRYSLKELSLEQKFIDEECVYIPEKLIFKINAILDGHACSKCNTFQQYAAPNQEDGSLICWYCRTYPDR